MLNFALTVRREEMVEMAAPPRRVLAAAKLADLGPIQDALDAAANSARRLRLRRPDRLEHLQHQGRVDRPDRQGSEQRVDIGRERRAPLPPMLWIFPRRL